MRSREAVLLALALVAGCASERPQYMFGCGVYLCQAYVPPGESGRLSDGPLAVSIDRVQVGDGRTNMIVDVTVKNGGSSDADFDPGLMEIFVPLTGSTYYHMTRHRAGSGSADVALSNLFEKTKLHPGQSVQGVLWYETPLGKADVPAFRVSYRGQTRSFPPGR